MNHIRGEGSRSPDKRRMQKVVGLITVDMSELKGEIESVASLLRSHQASVEVKGSRLTVDGNSTKEVKRILKRFLHHEGFSEYRVVSIRPQVVKVSRRKVSMKHGAGKRRRETPPSPKQTMPYLFPT